MKRGLTSQAKKPLGEAFSKWRFAMYIGGGVLLIILIVLLILLLA
jgi:hypothetical protein